MDIYQISETYGISMRKLRLLEKAKLLRLDAENGSLAKIRYYVAKRRTIPALHMVYLVENPESVFDLGNRAGEAQRQIDALELEADSAAPLAIAMTIDLAATRDNPGAVQGLADWLLSILPSEPVSYSYIAVRLLLGAKPGARALIASRLPKALLNVRALECFEGCSYVEKVSGRNATFYVNQKLGFDL